MSDWDAERSGFASRRAVLQMGAALAAVGCVGGDDGAKDVDLEGDSGAVGGGDTGEALEPAPERSPEPAPWEPPGVVDERTFPYGIQTGDALPDGVVVSVRSFGAPFSLTLVRAEGDAWVEDQVLTDIGHDENGEVAQVVLSGLRPDTAYSVAMQSAGGFWSRPGRFRTALAPDGWRIIRLGATSCLGGNEPWRSLSVAATEALDAFMLLGDTVYADGSVDLEDYRLFWKQAAQTRGMVELSASTSLIATWDDHEVDNNWSREDLPPGTFEDALTAFREALPQRRGPGGTGVWRSFTWGKTLEIFVLDCRGERGEGRYISEEQLQWLQDGLSASEARFKFILNSVPITDLSAIFGAAGASDRWQGYPEQRERVLRHIEDNAIAGVLWVTGDVHYPQVGQVDPVGGTAARQVEVFTGPGGSFLNVAASLFVGDPQYTWVGYAWNWCRFTLDPGLGTVLVQFVGDDGGLLYETTLRL
jgi:phosphodiesterase/alkaline phosphatase D-like protein